MVKEHSSPGSDGHLSMSQVNTRVERKMDTGTCKTYPDGRKYVGFS